jgi:hypothetical protein
MAVQVLLSWALVVSLGWLRAARCYQVRGQGADQGVEALRSLTLRSSERTVTLCEQRPI